MSSAGSTGDETADSDISLNDLSVDHNNELFAGAVADTCGDAMASAMFSPSEGELATEQHSNTKKKKFGSSARSPASKVIPDEDDDKRYLLADNSDYAAGVVLDESANLWSKAMTTIGKGKSSREDENNQMPNSSSAAVDSDDDGQFPKKKAARPAFDMGPILMDESIDGGMADPHSTSPARKAIPASDYSIDGESAMVWGDDPEKAYFAYMMEQEAEQRAIDGKDQDDSLLGESVRQELMNHQPEDEVTFDGDSTTLGHGSKAMGWDRNTAIESSNIGNVSSLTPSQLASSQEQKDKKARVVIPGVIYLQDGTDPSPDDASYADKEQAPPEKSKGFFGGIRRNSSAKNKAAPKQLDDRPNAPNNMDTSEGGDRSGWYTNRILIGFALFFLILTTGLVAALVVYRNNYAEETTTASANLDENGNPIMAPTQAPIIRNPRTFVPTFSLGKKEDDDAFVEAAEDDEDDEPEEPAPTGEPTWEPTGVPTWMPTEIPTFEPTRTPSAAPTGDPTSGPSFVPTSVSSLGPTQIPSTQPTETVTRNPTGVPSMSPSNATDIPTTQPTR